MTEAKNEPVVEDASSTSKGLRRPAQCTVDSMHFAIGRLRTETKQEKILTILGTIYLMLRLTDSCCSVKMFRSERGRLNLVGAQ